MAARGLFRCANGANRLSQRSILQNTVLRQNIATTTEVKGRIYGPTAPDQPAITSHWKAERVLSIALLPLIPAALAVPTAAFDMGLSAVMVLHTHWGFKSVITDYIHVDVPKMLLLRFVELVSILTAAGLFYLCWSDIGFARAAKKVFTDL